MTRFRATAVALLMLAGACLDGGRAGAQPLIATPGTSGDQLLFFYDATSGHAPFLVVSNFSEEDLTIAIAWYSQDLSQRLLSDIRTLEAGRNVILDPSQVTGVNGNAGLTVVTPVVGGTDARPRVPSLPVGTLASTPGGALAGGFTLADLSANSAFGQNPLARLAVDAEGKRATPGAIVDGTKVRYQRIGPDTLVVPFYFNPSSGSLANRAFLGAFEDRYGGSGFLVGPVSLSLAFRLIDANGRPVTQGTTTVNGVAFPTVQSLAGAAPLTSSGKVILTTGDGPLPADANLIGLFSQSLGTFAVGQGLPGYFSQQGRFVDNGDVDGTVTDRQTGLQWEKKIGTIGEACGNPQCVERLHSWTVGNGEPNGSIFTELLWGLNTCSTTDGTTLFSAGFAGHCDWRLPTLSELQSILTASPCNQPDPCIDPIFGATANGVYCSDTNDPRDSRNVWGVSFSSGNVFNISKIGAGCYARAVRTVSTP